MSASLALEFVDTNILIYAYDILAGSKRTSAKALLERLWYSQLGCVSIQVLQEFYVNVTRKLATPVGYEAACQAVLDLSEWRVHSPQPTDVVGAAHIARKHGLSFWDAMILRSAARLECRLLWSEDLESGRTYDGVTVLNPFTTAGPS